MENENIFELPKTEAEILSLMETINSNRKKIGKHKAKKLGLEILGLMQEIQEMPILATKKTDKLFDIVFSPETTEQERLNKYKEETEICFGDIIDADIKADRFDSIAKEIYIKLISGANLNVATQKNDILVYPLRLALASNLFELFLIGGASPDSFDKYTSEYIIMEACSLGLFNDVDLLCVFGADTNVHNINKEYPIHRATENFEFDVDGETLKILLENGANPNVQDLEGTSALHNIAEAEEDIIDGMELMHKYGADINIVNDINQVPLIALAYNDKINQIKYLISLLADPTIIDKADNAPVDYASSKEAISLLRDYEEKWVFLKPRQAVTEDNEQDYDR